MAHDPCLDVGFSPAGPVAPVSEFKTGSSELARRTALPSRWAVDVNNAATAPPLPEQRFAASAPITRHFEKLVVGICLAPRLNLKARE